jgi:dTDP-4-amino-4,6-dideoxygalactose transaminase
MLGSRPAGSYGIGCFSLYATKNVTSGEGGIITTDDTALADRMRVLRNQGMRQRYEYETPGHNYRLTDLQAAVALPQMASLRDTTARRATNAARLTDGLSGIPGLIVPEIAEGRGHVWHQYTVRLTERCAMDRDQLAKALLQRGIGTGIYYPRLVFDYECYRRHPNVRCSSVPMAERAARQVLSLPVHPHLTDADVDRVVGAIRELLHA